MKPCRECQRETSDQAVSCPHCGAPLPARGVIAIGQFAFGILTLSQFGIGFVSISQFTIALYALGQFAFACSLVAQFGVYIQKGHGQLVNCLTELMGML